MRERERIILQSSSHILHCSILEKISWSCGGVIKSNTPASQMWLDTCGAFEGERLKFKVRQKVSGLFDSGRILIVTIWGWHGKHGVDWMMEEFSDTHL